MSLYIDTVLDDGEIVSFVDKIDLVDTNDTADFDIESIDSKQECLEDIIYQVVHDIQSFCDTNAIPLFNMRNTSQQFLDWFLHSL